MKNIEALLSKLYLGGFISAKARDMILQEFFERAIDIEKISAILIYNIYKQGNPKKISHKMPINPIGTDILTEIFSKNFSLPEEELNQVAIFTQLTFAKK